MNWKTLYLYGTRIWVSLLVLCCLISVSEAAQVMDDLTEDFYFGIQQNVNIDNDELKLPTYTDLKHWQGTDVTLQVEMSVAVIYNHRIYRIGGYGIDGTGPSVATALSVVKYGEISTDGNIPAWHEVAATSVLPEPRYGHASVVVNGRIYVIGGRNSVAGTQASVIWAKIDDSTGAIVADGHTNTWNSVADLPIALFKPQAVAYQGWIYVIGGSNNSDVAQDGVYRGYVEPDGRITAWLATAAQLPTARVGHAAVQADGKIYLLGGSTTGEPAYTVADVSIGQISETGDITAWITAASLPQILYGSAATIAAGQIWVTGGLTSGTAQATVYHARLNQETGQIPNIGEVGAWALSVQLPESVYDHAMVATANHFYVLGGYSGTGIHGNVQAGELRKEFTFIESVPAMLPLFQNAYGGNVYDTWTGQSAVIRSGRVMVIGGGPNTYSAYTGYVEHTITDAQPAAYNTVYNSEVDTDGSLQIWDAPDTGGSIPVASILHASTIANGVIYVVGGVNSMNAWIWAGGASRSITASGVWDSESRPLQAGRTVVMYEEVGQGSAGSGVGTFDFTAPIPIYDPLYEASVATYPPTTISGFQGNTALPIYQPLIRHATVADNGNIYVIGGVSRQNNGWAAGEPAGESSAVFEDRVWFCHPNPNGTINEVGGVGGWQTTTALPASRYDAAACVVYDWIYLFGGRDSGGNPMSDIYRAEINPDGTLGAWMVITPSLPIALAELQVILMNGTLYVIGGVNNTGTLCNTIYYCTPDQTTGLIPAAWDLSDTTLEYPVAGHSVVGGNGFIYSLGGRYNTADPHTSTAYGCAITDLEHSVDIQYAWQGNFERYMEFADVLGIDTISWEGNTNNGTIAMRFRYAEDNGSWSGWQTVDGPQTVTPSVKNLHYAIRLSTSTNAYGAANNPQVSRVMINTSAATQTATPTATVTVTPGLDTFGREVLAFPNPARDRVTFVFQETDADQVVIELYNISGERIAHIEQTKPGQMVVWDAAGIAPGIYLYTVKIVKGGSEERLDIRKIAIVR